MPGLPIQVSLLQGTGCLGLVLGSDQIGSCKKQHPAGMSSPVRRPQRCRLWIEPCPQGGYRLRKENVLVLNSWQVSAVRGAGDTQLQC